jgi:hypothetical protein
MLPSSYSEGPEIGVEKAARAVLCYTPAVHLRTGPVLGPVLAHPARYQQKGTIVSFLHVGDTVCWRSKECLLLWSCLIPEYLGPVP